MSHHHEGCCVSLESCIYKVPVFQVLPDDSVARLQAVLRHGYYEPGEVLVHYGQPVQHLIVVARGALKLSRLNKSGREQVLRELGPGQFYGEMALFTEMVCEGQLEAMMPTQACLLERTAVQAELKGAPQLAWPLLEAIALRLSDAERTIGELALLDVGERLAAELLRLAADHAAGDSASFDLPITWAQLATRIGTTPESLSRRLKDLTATGYVAVEGRRITVRNMDELRDMVGVDA